MTERINTTATEVVSGIFSMLEDWSVQAEFATDTAAAAIVVIEGRVDANAPWVRLRTIAKGDQIPIRRFSPVPYARVSVFGNTAGKALKVWTT